MWKSQEKEKTQPHKKTRRGGQRNRQKRWLCSERAQSEVSHSVLNLSKKTLSTEDITLLSMGLNFSPKRHFNLFDTILDVNKFVRAMTLRKHYHSDVLVNPLGVCVFHFCLLCYKKYQTKNICSNIKQIKLVL